jgi:hypothetical protein
MRGGHFIPCYIDAFFPEVGIATLELLERFGHEVVCPRDCAQPMGASAKLDDRQHRYLAILSVAGPPRRSSHRSSEEVRWVWPAATGPRSRT